MFRRKRGLIAGISLTAIALSAVYLLKSSQKEIKEHDIKAVEVSRAINNEESKLKGRQFRTPMLSPEINILPLIIDSLSIVRDIEDLEYRMNNDFKEIKLGVLGINYSTIEDTEELQKQLEKYKQNDITYISILEKQFNNFKKMYQVIIDRLKKEKTLFNNKAAENLKNSLNLKNEQLKLISEDKYRLESIQKKINDALLKIAPNIELNNKLVEYADKMNELNDKVSKLLQAYDIIETSFNEVRVLYEEALERVDIDGSYRINFPQEVEKTRINIEDFFK